MGDRKKPDNVAWDEKQGRYISSILPYSTNVGGPVIKLDDVGGFKDRGVSKVQKTFNAKYKELIDEYNKLIDEAELNNLFYNSKFSFEPIIGEIYHIYVGKDGNYFLSLISPNEWNLEHIISARLNSEHKWVLIKDL